MDRGQGNAVRPARLEGESEADMGDAFEVLGLPATFGLHDEEIESAYLAAVAGVHPDLAAGDPDAAARMASLNEARAVLLNAEQRAGAVLGRLGGPSAAEEKGLPPGFLMSIMEDRQAMEEELAGAGVNIEAAASKWEAWGRERRAEAIDEIAALLARASEHSGDLAARRAVRVRLNAWRYIERLLEQVRGGGRP